jgi:hypothetical protein
MQTLYQQTIQLKFILLTEEISFIPDNILNNCQIIPISRPTKSQYNKILKAKLPNNIRLEEITNIKNINASITQLMNPHVIICNRIIENMNNVNELKFGTFRDMLYEIFIYNLDITDCIWYILNTLINEGKISLFKKEYNTENAHWIFALRIIGNNKSIEETTEFFKTNNVDIRPFFYPINKHGHLSCIENNDEISLILNKEIIMIPSSPSITIDEQQKVIDVISRFFQTFM